MGVSTHSLCYLIFQPLPPLLNSNILTNGKKYRLYGHIPSLWVFKNSIVFSSLMTLEISAQLGFSLLNSGPYRAPLLACFSSRFLFPQLKTFYLLSGDCKEIILIFCSTFLVFRGRVGLKRPNLPLTELKDCCDHFWMKIILRFSFTMFLFFFKNLSKNLNWIKLGKISTEDLRISLLKLCLIGLSYTIISGRGENVFQILRKVVIEFNNS